MTKVMSRGAPESHIYLDDVFGPWTDHLRQTKTPRTCGYYRWAVRSLLGDRPLDDPASVTAGMAVYTHDRSVLCRSITASRNLYNWMRATDVLPEDTCNRAVILLSPANWPMPHGGRGGRGK